MGTWGRTLGLGACLVGCGVVVVVVLVVLVWEVFVGDIVCRNGVVT